MKSLKLLSRSIGGPHFERALGILMRRACVAQDARCQLPQDVSGKQTRPAFTSWLDPTSQEARNAPFNAAVSAGEASETIGRVHHLAAGQSRQQQVNVGNASTSGQCGHRETARSMRQTYVLTSGGIGFRRFSTTGEVDIREKPATIRGCSDQPYCLFSEGNLKGFIDVCRLEAGPYQTDFTKKAAANVRSSTRRMQSFIAKHMVEDINSKFAEAREEIDLAMEAKDTVFFNEEALGAKKLVEEVLEEFRSLLDQVDERRRGELQRSMGMKMEQLKAEAAQLDEASS